MNEKKLEAYASPEVVVTIEVEKGFACSESFINGWENQGNYEGAFFE